MTIAELSLLITTSTGAIAATAVTILKIVKNKKISTQLTNSENDKKAAQDKLEIIKAVPKFMIDVENMEGVKGLTKKTLVESDVNRFCIDKGLTFDKTDVDEIIDENIKLSKNINKRDKDALSGASAELNTNIMPLEHKRLYDDFKRLYGKKN